MDFIQIFLIGIAAFVVAVLSSAGQGGGNFILLPLLLMMGLPPSIANGCLTISSLGYVWAGVAGFKDVKVRDKRTVIVMTIIAIITGLFVPFVLSRINGDSYGVVIGALLLVVAPVLHKKPFGTIEKDVSKKSQYIGYGLLFLLTVMARLTLAIGALFSYVLCHFYGMTVLEASLARKQSALVSGTLVAIIVTITGFVNWPVALALTIPASVGSYLGTRLSVRKGNEWTAKLMIIGMVVSGITLIMTSI